MQFLVLAYDGTDSGALDRRMAARPAHIELGHKMRDEGKLHMATTNSSFASLVSLAVMTFNIASAEEIDRITVRHKNSKDVKILQTPSEITRFNEIWNSKVKTTSRGPSYAGFDYKISNVPGTRDTWVYDAAGFTRVLSMKVGTDYRISDPEKFNELLGIKKSANVDTAK